MNVRWLGHSSFCLTESTGTAVVTDPFDPYVGIEMPKVRADVVTTSHSHKDHNAIHLVDGASTVIDQSGAFEVKGIHVFGIDAKHDGEQGSLRGDVVIYKFRIDGVEVCHMGDIGEECSPEIVEAIGTVNVLLIPVGGNYTIDAKQAKEYVDRLMPDIVVPMHYRSKGVEFDIDKVDDFLDLFEEEDVIYLDTADFDVTRSQFDGERTRVVIPKL